MSEVKLMWWYQKSEADIRVLLEMKRSEEGEMKNMIHKRIKVSARL
jgi:hypothetical protein